MCKGGRQGWGEGEKGGYMAKAERPVRAVWFYAADGEVCKRECTGYRPTLVEAAQVDAPIEA